MVSEGRTDGLTPGSCFGARDVSDFTFRNAEVMKALFVDMYFTLAFCLVSTGEKVISSDTSSTEVGTQLLP